MIRKKHPTENLSNIKTDTMVLISKTGLIFIVFLMVAIASLDGFLYAKAKRLEKFSVNDTVGQAQTPDQQQPEVQQQPQAQNQISLDTIKELFSKNVIKFGKGDKKLLMVEIADPSCPYCAVAGGANKEIGSQMGAQFAPGTYVAPVPEMKKLIDQGKADFVWIYTRGHGNGELGTKALYCAYDQGKFWQAHDLLMSAKGYDLLNNQIKTDLTKTKEISNFLASAVDSNKLKSCLDSGKYDSRLQEDSGVASSLGVNGTPGFFLNTNKFAGAYSWNDMKSTADEALKK